MAQSIFPIITISSGNGLRFFKGVPQLESRKLHFLGTRLPSQNCEKLMTYQAPCVIPSGLRIPAIKRRVTKGGLNEVSLVPRKPNMNLSGKMMMHVEIDSSGDVLYDIVRYRPNDLATILPDKVQGCYLLDGQWGAVGSIICWNFTYGT
nr:kirola-like [Tanacetum cinerariifolium]